MVEIDHRTFDFASRPDLCMAEVCQCSLASDAAAASFAAPVCPAGKEERSFQYPAAAIRQDARPDETRPMLIATACLCFRRDSHQLTQPALRSCPVLGREVQLGDWVL